MIGWIRQGFTLLIGMVGIFSATAQAPSSNDEFGVLPPSTLGVRLEGLDPSVLMGQAWRSFYVGQLGEALLFARQAMRLLGDTSEGHYLIGLVFLDEGEFTLAEQHLQRALHHQDRHNMEDLYLLALVNVHLGAGNEEAYVRYLNTVVHGTNHLSDVLRTARENEAKQRSHAKAILLREGLDRVIQMYRWPADLRLIGIEALGFYHYGQKTDQSDELAVEYFLHAMVAHVGVLIDRMLFYDPSYVFTGLDTLLRDAQRHEEMRVYIESSDLYRVIFMLAASVYAYNRSPLSKVIWNRLRMQPGDSVWISRAQARFLNPDVDEFVLGQSTFAQLSLPKVY